MRLSTTSISLVLSVVCWLQCATALDEPESFLKRNDQLDETASRELQQLSIGEIACQQELQQCRDEHEPGTLSIEGWSAFLGQLGGDDDSAIGQIRKMLEQIRPLDSETLIKEIEESTTTPDDILDAMTALSDWSYLAEGLEKQAEAFVKDGDEIQENDVVAVTKDFIYVLQQIRESLFPIDSPEKAWIVDNIVIPVLYIVTLPITIIPGLLVYGLLIFVMKASGFGRAYATDPFMRSSIECEAQLLSCEYELMLSNVVPALVQQAFIEAGTTPAP